MKLHVLRQIAPYPNNSLAQSPSKLIRSHAGDWIGGRHLSYSRIGLPNADHPIIQSAQNQQQHYPVVLIWQIRTLPIIQKGLAFGCERSGTATVPGVSSSSVSCPAGSRSYGRSRRPRQHEAFDCHAFKRNRQEECVQMPVKIARSAPRASFGLPELLVASTPRVSLATRPERREYSRQFGSHPGNPGFTVSATPQQKRDLSSRYGCLALSGRLRP